VGIKHLGAFPAKNISKRSYALSFRLMPNVSSSTAPIWRMESQINQLMALLGIPQNGGQPTEKGKKFGISLIPDSIN